MCGRYGFTSSDKELSDRFDLELVSFVLRDSYNVAPTQEMPIVERHSPNSLHMRKWGVQPGWSKIYLINAKAEGVATSNVWKNAFSESRCIVPASWFYEWKRLEDGKQPYLIRLKNKAIMGFAGLIVTTKDKDGKEQTGYVIITTEPNKLMSDIHNRMPVILRKEDEDEWLNPDNTEPEKLIKFLKPYPTQEMEAYTISSLVNSPKNNDPSIVRPYVE